MATETHTCQPEMTKNTEIFLDGPAGSRQSVKPHNMILEHMGTQHASVYNNKLRFPKHLVVLLEVVYIGQSERTPQWCIQYWERSVARLYSFTT